MELWRLRHFVAVAEELHFGRAATRLHITQPPLSRSIRALEADLGCALFERSAQGVRLTTAGATLLESARGLLAHAERVRAELAGGAALTVGTLAGSASDAGPRLIAGYRREHPEVRIRLREADLTDPTTGLRSGLVDVALTRLPFDTAGIAIRVLRTDPLVAVLPGDDPLAGRDRVHVDELAGRRWFRLPEQADPVWRAYWSGLTDPAGHREGPVVRTVGECLQSVLWDGAVGIMPAAHPLPTGVAAVPLAGMPPSRLVVAWPVRRRDRLVRSFVAAAVAAAVAAPVAAPVADAGPQPG